MIRDNIESILKRLPSGVRLVAVSKFHPADDIALAYEAGQRVFAESRPQELAAKVPVLPEDIEWHFIGHLQTNKLKLVLPYVSLVQSVDSAHLLAEIDKWGKANGRVTEVLLELHVALEESKQGFLEEELLDTMFRYYDGGYPHVRIRGIMAMATNTADEAAVRADFSRAADFKAYLDDLFPELDGFDQLSLGMSSDWQIAVEEGSTMVRIGTAIFGERK